MFWSWREERHSIRRPCSGRDRFRARPLAANVLSTSSRRQPLEQRSRALDRNPPKKASSLEVRHNGSLVQTGRVARATPCGQKGPMSHRIFYLPVPGLRHSQWAPAWKPISLFLLRRETGRFWTRRRQKACNKSSASFRRVLNSPGFHGFVVQERRLCEP